MIDLGLGGGFGGAAIFDGLNGVSKGAAIAPKGPSNVDWMELRAGFGREYHGDHAGPANQPVTASGSEGHDWDLDSNGKGVKEAFRFVAGSELMIEAMEKGGPDGFGLAEYLGIDAAISGELVVDEAD